MLADGFQNGYLIVTFMTVVKNSKNLLVTSVADPHHFDAVPDADPDPSCHFDADVVPDPSSKSLKSPQIGSYTKHVGLLSAR
jgi:hypothetical protein